MTVAAEQLQIASSIDAKVQELANAGCDNTTILGEMFDHMPGFKRLMETSQRSEMDELCRRFPWFYHYAKILEGLAKGLQSGTIKIPK
jgi:hypothetical protein